MRLFHGMAHGKVRIDLVVVASPDAGALHVAGVDEVGDDGLGGTFGDPDPSRDVTSPDARVLSHADQDVPVVGEERPGWLVLLGPPSRRHRWMMVAAFVNRRSLLPLADRA